MIGATLKRPRLARYHRAVDRFRQRLIRHTLARTGGNVRTAAQVLGLNRTDLYKLMGRYGIEIPKQPSESVVLCKLLAWPAPPAVVPDPQDKRRRPAWKSTRSITRSSSSELPPS